MSDLMVTIPHELVEFLRGVAPLDGAWFGGDPPPGEPCYWWRKYLRAALATGEAEWGLVSASQAVERGQRAMAWLRDHAPRTAHMLAAGEARPVDPDDDVARDGFRQAEEAGRICGRSTRWQVWREAVRWAAARSQPAIPEGYKLVPAWKGYALLGTGQYVINHSAPPAHPVLGAELFITIATEADKSGNRQVGESRDNPPDAPPVQPEDMVIRIGFLSERAVFALEDQLRALREAHGWSAAPVVTDEMVMAGWQAIWGSTVAEPTPYTLGLVRLAIEAAMGVHK